MIVKARSGLGGGIREGGIGLGGLSFLIQVFWIYEVPGKVAWIEHGVRVRRKCQLYFKLFSFLHTLFVNS